MSDFRLEAVADECDAQAIHRAFAIVQAQDGRLPGGGNTAGRVLGQLCREFLNVNGYAVPQIVLDSEGHEILNDIAADDREAIDNSLDDADEIDP